MNIGLIGYGGVGKACIKLLIDKKDFLKDKGIAIKVKYIIKSNGGIYIKEGIDLDEVIALEYDIIKHKDFNKDININNIIKNKDIETLVELTNTDLETGGVGLNHLRLALENKINVVTGNKGPIVLDYNNLKTIATKNKVKLLFGCTTGGALPTLNAGTYNIAGSEIIKIEGILNGTSNYILTEMYENYEEYEVVLNKAIKEKIAETNYRYDVEGYDTAAKISIVANALMEANLKLKDIKIEGITKVTKEEILREKEKGNKPKLIGSVYKDKNKIKAEVKLEFIDKNHSLYFVDSKNKGITYYTDTLGNISVIGGASGTRNAAAAILRDIVNFN
jgi:homoserine dehydrogenase